MLRKYVIMYVTKLHTKRLCVIVRIVRTLNGCTVCTSLNGCRCLALKGICILTVKLTHAIKIKFNLIFKSS